MMHSQVSPNQMRVLSDAELEEVSGGDLGQTLLDFLGWAMGGGTETSIANRFTPEPGQTVLNEGREIRQTDGDIWLDFDNDGQMDARLWENPTDGDNKTDYRWNESGDVWESIPDSTVQDWVDDWLSKMWFEIDTSGGGGGFYTPPQIEG